MAVEEINYNEKTGEVTLIGETARKIQEYADEHGMTPEEAFNSIIQRAMEMYEADPDGYITKIKALREKDGI